MDSAWRFRVDDRNDETAQQPEGNESLLVVGESIVFISEGSSFEDFGRIKEV